MDPRQLTAAELAQALANLAGTVPADQRAPDSQGARSVEVAAQALDDPRAFLELDLVFTPPLRESERFGDAFVKASNELAVRGSVGAMLAV